MPNNQRRKPEQPKAAQRTQSQTTAKLPGAKATAPPTSPSSAPASGSYRDRRARDRTDAPSAPAILPRKWIRKRAPRTGESSIRIMCWNMLAQGLARPDAFRNNDCLAAELRDEMIAMEMLAYDPDIACFQEVDRLSKRITPLAAKGYSHIYTNGPMKKKHGLMIIYKDAKFVKVQEQSLAFDECFLRDSPVPTLEDESPEVKAWRRGRSRETSNLGLIAALQRVPLAQTPASSGPPTGYIVATCHLYWHPRHFYERARQAAILVQEISRFQRDNRLEDWPILLTGDFNTEPHDSLYALLVGDTLSPSQVKDLEDSAAVHASIDPSVEITVLSTSLSPSALRAAKKAAASDPAARVLLKKHRGEDPTREYLVNVRPAVPTDGLFSVKEFLSAFPSLSSPNPSIPFTSTYGSAFRAILSQDRSLSSISRKERALNVFSSRIGKEDVWDTSRKGADEPMYTNYTRQWKITLDYIFWRSPSPNPPTSIPQRSGEVIALLTTPSLEDLDPGLPKRGVTASDHVSLVAEIDF